MAEIRPELLEELLADYEKPEDLIGPDGLLKDLFKRLIETAAGAELTDHLGYERGDPAGRGSGNSRNGTTSKTLLSDHGDVSVDMCVPETRSSAQSCRLGSAPGGHVAEWARRSWPSSRCVGRCRWFRLRGGTR
jgi:Transposase, Mutator family